VREQSTLESTATAPSKSLLALKQHAEETFDDAAITGLDIGRSELHFPESELPNIGR
jgi:hypothetical protein